MVQRLTLPTFDWENLIPDGGTRHALQDYAVQVNEFLQNLQDQITVIEDTDTGVPPHNLLQSDIHLDTVTDAPSPGSLIHGTPADAADMMKFWFKGLPADFLEDELVTGGCKFWFKGLPFDGISSLTDGDVKWEELLIGPDTYVVTSRGSRVEWAAVNAFGNRPTASASLAANVSLAIDTVTTLTPLDPQFDNGGFWSSSNPSRLTVPTGQGGTYFVIGRTNWLPNSLGQIRAILLKNGTALDDPENDFGSSLIEISRLVEMNAGDYVELAGHWHYVDPGGTRTIRSGITRTFLQLVRVN